MQGLQQYKYPLIVIITLLIIGALIFWLQPKNDNSSSTSSTKQSNDIVAPTFQSNPELGSLKNYNFASTSQQDTEINCQLKADQSGKLIVNEQVKNCFEYFITQFGERNLNEIKQTFESYAKQTYKEPLVSQLIDLWGRYLKYRQEISNIQPPAINKEDTRYYQAIFSEMNDIKKRLFSSVEIEGLFGLEDTYHDYTLKRMTVLDNNKLSESEKAKQLQDLFNDLPQDWQENLKQLNQLDDLRRLTADIKARGGSADDIRQMRLNLVGPDATSRLENLDTERATWKNKVTTYLSEREQITKSSMSDNAKQQAIDQLRASHFKNPQEQLRAETFETVHDLGGKLPFAD